MHHRCGPGNGTWPHCSTGPLTPTRSRDPNPTPGPSRAGCSIGRAVTGLLVIGPAVALAIAVPLLWGHAVTLRDIILAGAFYVVTAFGVTVGYHRLFTHRSFRAARWLKIVLALRGLACGRRLGRRLGRDPPPAPRVQRQARRPALTARLRDRPRAQLRGFAHAHVGWLFKVTPTAAERYAPDLLATRDTKIISRLFPLFAVVSLAAPFFLGWTLSGALSGALTALLWAGLARMMLLHHVTWSVELDLPHVRAPARNAEGREHATSRRSRCCRSASRGTTSITRTRASARHGALPHQIDLSAGLIRLFERAGWATHVQLADPTRNSRSAGRHRLVCFAPEADALVGGIVIAVGVDALRHVREPKQIPLAALPLLFGVHQLSEAFVWWGLQGSVSHAVERVAVWTYLLFAFGALPVLIPVAVGLVEPLRERRRDHRRVRPARCRRRPACSAIAMFRGSIHAMIDGRHIEYEVDAVGYGGQLTALYVVATCGALIASQLSRHRRARGAEPRGRAGADVAHDRRLRLAVVLLGRDRQHRDRPPPSPYGDAGVSVGRMSDEVQVERNDRGSRPRRCGR